jgi:co-chaperonin GroES (HSP10)
VNFRPLGDRVLIRPEKPSDISDGGIHLVEARKPDECGEIVAVGVHPRRALMESVADWLDEHYDSWMEAETQEDAEPYVDAARWLREHTVSECSVKVGDTVLFSWASGQEITVDDGKETYLLMRESDLLAVLED